MSTIKLPVLCAGCETTIQKDPLHWTAHHPAKGPLCLPCYKAAIASAPPVQREAQLEPGAKFKFRLEAFGEVFAGVMIESVINHLLVETSEDEHGRVVIRLTALKPVGPAEERA